MACGFEVKLESLDFESAFPQSLIDKYALMSYVDADGKTHIVSLIQSRRLWWKTLTKVLIESGLRQTPLDDLIVTSNSDKLRGEFIAFLRLHFIFDPPERLSAFTEMKIIYLNDHQIKLSTGMYILAKSKEFGIDISKGTILKGNR